MSLIQVGKNSYIDTDDFDQETYAEFCEHKENIIKYYKLSKNKEACAKALMSGIDLKKTMNDAREWFKRNIGINGITLESTMSVIARDGQHKIGG
jgi:hypothetical protein